MAKEKIKIYYDEEKEDIPFPELINYENILYTPQRLEDINKPEGDKLATDLNKITDNSDDLIQGTTNRFLLPLSVTEGMLADLAVATAKIRDDAITAAKVWKGGAVITLSAQIGTAIIQSAHIGTAQIMRANIADLAVDDAKIANLSADKITVGTLTGRRVQTAATGTRVMMGEHGHPSFPDHLVFYNLHGHNVLQIRGGGDFGIFEGRIMFPSGIGESSPVVWENPFGFRSLEVWETRLMTRSVIPLDTGIRDLGSSALRWRDLWLANRLVVGGDAFISGHTVTSHCYPDTNNTRELGLTTRKWSWAHYVNRGTCDLPTSKNAIELIKKVKPCKVKKGLHGKRHYFEDDKDFPDEMKCANEKNEKEMELTRVTGVMLGAVKELIEKVEILEKKC